MSSKSSSSSSPTSRKKKAKSTKKSATKGSRKPSRKTRTRTRKPKYLSLKLELFPSQQQQQKKKTKTQTPQKPTMPETTKQQQQQQLNLFPLHPENMVLDLNDDHQQVAFLLETATDSSTSLQSLLDISSNTTSTATTSTTAATTTTSEDDPLSLYRGQQDQSEEVECGGGPSLLVRTAMRCKERDAGEERWVSYCEVVKKEPEEVSSDHDHRINSVGSNINPAAGGDDEGQGMKMGLVGLKLDYEEILNAWSDKKSLFIEGESPQTVPDLQDIVSLDNGLGSMMRVPEMGGMKMEKGQREASVLRYKEKRQSRLFSKRIRYEVRKLNAEKRPRLKGRFVKRSGEE